MSVGPSAAHDAVAAILLFDKVAADHLKGYQLRDAIDAIVRAVRNADGCRDRCYKGGVPLWRFCNLALGHAGMHTDGEASWRAGHDGPESEWKAYKPVTCTCSGDKNGGCHAMNCPKWEAPTDDYAAADNEGSTDEAPTPVRTGSVADGLHSAPRDGGKASSVDNESAGGS